ncbi:hypothetical protein [Acinetobacter sp. ANC 4639]|jgi:hypothetical protein
MSERNLKTENTIAIAAANVLHRSFIEATRTETVLYVEDDKLVKKTPNGAPVLVKRLSRSNSNLAQRVIGRGTFKIKKRNVEAIAE